MKGRGRHRGDGERQREYWNGNHEKGQRITSIGPDGRTRACTHAQDRALVLTRLRVRVSSPP